MTVSPQFCIFLTVLLLAVPLPWVTGWLVAAAVHELFHCLALLACGKRVGQIALGVSGARIQTESLTDGQSIFCSLAGPAGGLLLLCFANTFPRLALCALLQSAYNLLPIYPLDGGRAFYGFASLIFSNKTSHRLCRMVEIVAVSGILLFFTFAAFAWRLGMLPLLFSVLFILRLKRLKIPCK